MWLMIYILMSGMLLYIMANYIIKNFDKFVEQCDKHEKQELQDAMLSYKLLGETMNVDLVLLCLSMLLGWLILPMAIILKLLRLFNIHIV